MSIVLEIVLPVFGIILMGFFASRIGWFSEAAEKGVTHFTFNFACPMMLFNILSQVDLPSEPPLPFFASFYGPLLVVAVIGFALSRFVFRREYAVQVISGFGAAFGNTVLLGLPLLIIAFGEDQILPFYILLSVHGLTLFTVVTILLELGKSRQAGGEASQALRTVLRKIFVSLITNPILMAIVIGVSVNLSGITVPQALLTLSGFMKGAVIPAALFTLGSSLTRYGICGRLWESLSVVVLKIIILPILVYLSGRYLFEVNPYWVMIAVITAAQPPGVMTYMFATQYKVGEAVASTSIFLAAAGSLLTLTWILYFFDVR